MRLPRGYVLPDFLNLGIAPPPPRGALAVAPRAKLVPPIALAAAIPNMVRGFSPLLLPNYTLPAGAAWQGPGFTPPLRTPLAPNPYTRR